jgi:hypothetical protein
MTFSHPLARSAKVFTARNLDGVEEKILAVATTLELDPKGEHYKKRFVEKLSAAARDYVRKSDHVKAFVLINRLKDWGGSSPSWGWGRHSIHSPCFAAAGVTPNDVLSSPLKELWAGYRANNRKADPYCPLRS